ncbi:MAG: hypothetical protein ABSE48_16170, partial [Verrucomicrobiota bacterium]
MQPNYGLHLSVAGLMVQSRFLPAALTAAQRFLAAAAIFARAAALILDFLAAGLAATFTAGLAAPALAALIFAQRNFWAALILAMPAALIFFFAGLATALVAGAVVASPVIPASSVCSASIWSLIAAARFNWFEVNDDKLIIG